MLYITYII